MNQYVTDHTGKETLDVLAKAQRFNHWMFQVINPFIKGSILEIGSGTGNISRFFLQNNYQIMLSDFRPEYCENLNFQFNKYPNLIGVETLDLTHPDFHNQYSRLIGQFDTVFALNVIEHIKNDLLAIENCNTLLKPGGHLIILVPSYQFLYNGFDQELGHFRRYNKNKLSKLFIKNQIEIIHTQYFNLSGIFGWFFSGSVLRKKRIPNSHMKLYETLVPWWKMMDKIFRNRIGLSTIIIGRKLT